jgi:hypothetical protein
MDSPIARRAFLRLAAGLAGVSGLMRSAVAADYPARPVRLLVGQAAGSGSDIFSRLIRLVVGPSSSAVCCRAVAAFPPHSPMSIYAAVVSISRGDGRTGLILPPRSSSVARSALTGLEK